MKASTKASETSGTSPKAVQIVAGAGQLRAVMSKRSGRWQLAILREDSQTGEVGSLLGPADIEDLAVLTALIATALHEHAELDDVGLSDDLGCLGHELARMLGIGPSRSEYFPKPTVQ